MKAKNSPVLLHFNSSFLFSALLFLYLFMSPFAWKKNSSTSKLLNLFQLINTFWIHIIIMELICCKRNQQHILGFHFLAKLIIFVIIANLSRYEFINRQNSLMTLTWDFWVIGVFHYCLTHGSLIFSADIHKLSKL